MQEVEEVPLDVTAVPQGDADDHPTVVLIGFEGQENLGLRSIAAYLVAHGVSVRIEPCHSASNAEILTHLRTLRPQIVGFSLIFQRMLPDFAKLISDLRKGHIAAHFTMGGHFPTFAYAAVLDAVPGLDSIVRHEGERTMLELVLSLDDPVAWCDIHGLAFRQDGEIVVTPPRALIEDLDALPVPRRRATRTRHRGLGIRSIAGSRGCYYDCSFCSIQQFYQEPPGPKRRSRSPRHVVDEMELLYRDLDTRVFIFQDDDMLMRGLRHREWMREFIDQLHARGLADHILWRVSCRIDDLEADLLLRMKEAGLLSVYLGIESGNDQGLRTANKQFCVDDVLRAIDTLRDVDLDYEYGFMLLDPDSTLATVRENIDFLRWIDADGRSLVNFCKMIPYAGTTIAERLAGEGRLTGSLTAPDYRFHDRRLDLLEMFVSKTFNFRNFDDAGSVERLRFAKFDCGVLARLFPDQHELDAYRDRIADLIQRSNEAALRALSLATHLAEHNTYDRMLDFWPLLEGWGAQAQTAETQIGREIDQLMASVGFEADVR